MGVPAIQGLTWIMSLFALAVILSSHLRWRSWSEYRPPLRDAYTPRQDKQSMLIPAVSARPLRPEEQERKVLFLHVGKTAGTTIRCQFRLVLMETNCQKYFAEKEHRTELPNRTAISNRVVEVTHLWGHTYAYQNYTDFLVVLRNPVDRIESWWYYEQMMVRNGSFFAFGNSWYRALHGCYGNIGEMAEKGLRGDMRNRRIPANEKQGKPEGFTCEEISMACTAGDLPCMWHNYYNYEVYLENVLHWKEENTRPVRLDVIRGSHIWEDFDRINALWGGSPDLVIPANMRERNINNHKSTFSSKGRRNLCRALCREIVVYKTALKHASNLNEEEKIASSKEVDASCGGLDVDRECGTTFEYRNVKGKFY
jgi:Sulfotransferase family